MLLLSWVHVQASTRCSVLIVAQLCRNHASRLVQADTPGAVLLAGDLTYADDYNNNDRFGYQPRWDIWGRLTQPVFATVPLITTIGPRSAPTSLPDQQRFRTGLSRYRHDTTTWNCTAEPADGTGYWQHDALLSAQTNAQMHGKACRGAWSRLSDDPQTEGLGCCSQATTKRSPSSRSATTTQ